MILLEGAPALSPFRRDRLQARLQSVLPGVCIAGAWHGYWVDPDHGATPDPATLRRILQATDGFAAADPGVVTRYVVPRLGTLSPWASKATELLRGAGLDVWEFDHLLATQRPFAPYHRVRRPSSVIDVSGGYEPWLEDRRRAFRHSITAMGRKQRKLDREEGAVRFQFDTQDHLALDTLMRWKSAQYRRTGRFDRFARPATVQLVRYLLETCDTVADADSASLPSRTPSSRAVCSVFAKASLLYELSAARAGGSARRESAEPRAPGARRRRSIRAHRAER